MKKVMKAVAAIMLITMVACGTKPAKTDDSKKEENKTNTIVSEQDTHEWVDLDLPSGTLWATCNVGANKPEEHGDYFAWGETSSKSTYSSDNYVFTDNPDTLPESADAATANWGSEWCTPTKEQWEELKENTTNKWTSQNEVNGLLFVASNGNSIFFPAVGCKSENVLNDDGQKGFYHSSSLDDQEASWGARFTLGYCGVDEIRRTCGQPVRPVRSAK